MPLEGFKIDKCSRNALPRQFIAGLKEKTAFPGAATAEHDMVTRCHRSAKRSLRGLNESLYGPHVGTGSLFDQQCQLINFATI